MLLAQVEGFIEIARLGNMRRAADALSISQPALTARLQALEQELAAPLFRRTRYGHAPDTGRSRVPAICRPRDRGDPKRRLPGPRAGTRRRRGARTRRRSGGQRLRPAGDPRPLHGASSGRSTSRQDRALGGDRRPRGSRRGRARDCPQDPGRTGPQPTAVRGRARPHRPAGPPVRYRGHGRRGRDQARPAHPVRPNVELLRPDERPVPRCRRRPSRRHRGGQHRGGEADGRARARRGAPSGDGGRRRPRGRLGPRDRARGATTIRRQIVAVERPGARPTSPFSTTLWDLLEQIPELIPRALPVGTT